MRIFNLAEELEKERKKNKELQQELKEANESITWWSNRYNSLEEENIDKSECIEAFKDMLNKRDTIIDKAIEYIEKYCIDGVENEYNTPQTVFEEENGNEKDNARIELLDILRGTND